MTGVLMVVAAVASFALGICLGILCEQIPLNRRINSRLAELERRVDELESQNDKPFLDEFHKIHD